jgi:hypothetical protein
MKRYTDLFLALSNSVEAEGIECVFKQISMCHQSVETYANQPNQLWKRLSSTSSPFLSKSMTLSHLNLLYQLIDPIVYKISR